MDCIKYRKYVLNYHIDMKPIDNDVLNWFSTNQILVYDSDLDKRYPYFIQSTNNDPNPKNIYCIGYKLLFFMGRVELFYPVHSNQLFDQRKKINKDFSVFYLFYLYKLKIRYYHALIKTTCMPDELILSVLNYI